MALALPFSTDALEAARAETYSAEDLFKAERMVGRFQINDVPAQGQVQLYCAMRKLLNGDGAGRLSKKMFESWLRRLSFSTKVTRKYWVVPRESFSHLTDIPKVAVIEPNMLEIPQGVDVTQLVFLDQMVERKLLGPGALEMEVAMKEVFTATGGAPLEMGVAAGFPAEASKAQAEAPEAQAGDVQAEDKVPASPTKKRRSSLLHEEGPDEQELEHSLEQMARKIREAFEIGLFKCEDSLCQLVSVSAC